MLARSRHWLFLTFPLPSIPYNPLEKTWWLVLGYWEGTLLVYIVSDWKMPEDQVTWLFVLQSWSHFWGPQGSVLGLLLFTHYSTPLSNVISEHVIPHHLYTDDSQLYVLLCIRGLSWGTEWLQSCLASIQSWMLRNKLKPNPDKI